MADHIEKKCPKCGQLLRIPKNIGGMLMACPSCGKKFHSDFKIKAGRTRQSEHQSILITIFEMPCNILQRLGRFLFPK